MGRIKVAIVGVGNAASALVQGLAMVRDRGDEESGVLHPKLGGYRVSDIEIVAAFDIDARKVGKDLSSAIFSPPNNAPKFYEVPEMGVEVKMGVLKDSPGPITRRVIEVYQGEPADFVDEVRSAGADVVVNLVSSFSIESSKEYAKLSAEAGAGFINAVPVNIATDPSMAMLFRTKGVPVVGDDLESQVGSTYIHRILLEALDRRGVRTLATYALDVGGSPESLSALEVKRVLRKREIKTRAIRSTLPYDFQVMAGSVDYADFLRDLRDTVINIRGVFFAGAEVSIEMKIRCPDSVNAFNPLVDAIRGVKIAMDRGISGPLDSVSAYAFKNPPVVMPPSEAEEAFRAFVEGRRDR